MTHKMNFETIELSKNHRQFEIDNISGLRLFRFELQISMAESSFRGFTAVSLFHSRPEDTNTM